MIAIGLNNSSNNSSRIQYKPIIQVAFILDASIISTPGAYGNM